MANKALQILKGAIAGGVGVWLMDRFTWYCFSHENTDNLVKERIAQKGGRYAPNAAGKHLTDALGVNLPQKQQYIVGRSIHYLMGITPAACFSMWRHRMKGLGIWKGGLYGVGLFITFDEIITPGLGYASGPFAYPWEAHARGFFAHLILGFTTEAVLNLMEDTY